ncbi:MAG TPA: Fur family transcriptional regulator [Verrucomicrobiae bacterium]|nr:Fur family transcriptional regulator [Verrucomicrobiae bacterium]
MSNCRHPHATGSAPSRGCDCGHEHPPPREALASLTGQLREKALRITGPRQAILEILRRHPHPMTNKEILAALPKGECDLATVYRSMHLLQRMGMVKRFDFGDGAARFELVVTGEDGHHHHLVCTCCAAIVEIEECFSREWEQQLATRHGFKAISHKLEFFGLCPRCQSA